MHAQSVFVTSHALRRWHARLDAGATKADVRAALLRSRPATRRQFRRGGRHGAVGRYDPQTGAVMVVRYEVGKWVVRTAWAAGVPAGKGEG